MSIEDNLYNQKWQKFLGRIWLFNFIPFVDFVLASGSLATGNIRPPHNLRQKVMWGMHENSDFDVIIGVRQGRIFTARFFCWLIFGMFGWRAKHKMRPQPTNAPESTKRIRIFGSYSGHSDYSGSSDRLCFNHFVTPAAYRLSPPHNEYWKNLYRTLVPVYGNPADIQKFFDANADWANPISINKYLKDPRYKYQKRGLVARIREWILGGWFGDQLEKLKFIQVYFIKRGLKNTGYKSRIIFNDNELEFHPDTKRIEDYLAQ